MATFTRVQTAKANQGSGASITASFTNGVTQGNLLVAQLSSDSDNQTWTPPSGWPAIDINFNDSSNGHQDGIFHFVVTAGVAGTKNFAFSTSVSGNSTFVQITEWQSSTGWKTSPFDKSATHSNASGTTLSAGTTATTSQASELAVACTSYPAPAVTQSGYTSGWSAGVQQVQTGDMVQQEAYASITSIGTVSLSYTLSSARAGTGCIATYMPNTGSTDSSGVVDVGSAVSGLSITATVIEPTSTVNVGSAISGLSVTAFAGKLSGVVNIGAATSGLMVAAIVIEPTSVVNIGAAVSGLSVQATVIVPSGFIDIGAAVSGLHITATVVRLSGLVDVGAALSGLSVQATVIIPSGVVELGIGASASGLLILAAREETSLLYDDVQDYYAAIRAVPTLLAQIQFMAKVYFPPAIIIDESSVPGEIDILLTGETWSDLHELKTIAEVNNFIATYS
ncbi:MAG TPA: hypothetical protein VH593_20270 [Ktedonobacteraceae bacterium]